MKFIVNRFLWLLLGFTLGVFYRFRRRVHTTGLDKVPRDKPLLLCSNHPNAFMDALLVATTVTQPTHFLVRSDVFRKKWQARALAFLNLIPIYRIQEGVENLQKNDETFRICNEHLKNGDTIIIFSEGLCIQERRLRKLKKGTARIAFGAEEAADFKMGLTVVPVGINYTSRPWKFRKSLFISFGEPFEVRQFEERFRNEKARAMTEFTNFLEQKMAEQLVVIPDKANDQLIADLEEMFLAPWSVDQGRDPRNQKQTHETTKEIVKVVTAVSDRLPEQTASFRQKVRGYLEKVESLGLRDWLLREDTIMNMRAVGFFFDFLLLTLLLPFFVAGLLLNAVPFFVPFRIAKKIVRNMEWHASVNVTLGTFIGLFWYIILWITAALLFNWWIGLIALFSFYPLGRIAWWYFVRWKKFNGRRKLLSLVRKKQEETESLLKLRREIKADMEAMREAFLGS